MTARRSALGLATAAALIMSLAPTPPAQAAPAVVDYDANALQLVMVIRHCAAEYEKLTPPGFSLDSATSSSAITPKDGGTIITVLTVYEQRISPTPARLHGTLTITDTLTPTHMKFDAPLYHEDYRCDVKFANVTTN